MAIVGPSPSKDVEDSNTAASAPKPSENQKALEMDLEDVIKFVEQLPDELQCPLCLEFLKEPTLTSCCGHHFCRECTDRAITRSHICPLCNNQGFQTLLLLDKEKQRLINALKVYCKWKSRGCEWVGELGRLERHLDMEEGDCGCVEVECEFGPVGCVAKLPRKDLQRHKEENVHKHLVLMSVMSLKSNEALVKELREQRMEFQQQLKQKDEALQAIQKSLQQQVGVTQELRGQLQQKDQQIADIRDQLLQRGKQIAAVHQNMEAKQQTITNLERQLKGEAQWLAQVEAEVTENTKQFVKMESKLQDKDQQLTMHERKNEKRLGDVERKRLEEKQEVSRRVAAVYKEVQEAKMQSRVNEKRLDDFERKQQEEKLVINRRLADVDRKIEERREEAWTQFQRGHNQAGEEMTCLRRRIGSETSSSLAGDQGLAKEVNEKVQKQLVTFTPPLDFTMTDYEQHQKDDDNWFSPPFWSHMGGYKMRLRAISAKGQGRGKGTHVSIFVHLMRGEHDDYLKWPFRGDIRSVLNQRREEGYWAKTIPFDDGSDDDASSRVTGRGRAMTGFGSSTFIAHSALGYNPANDTQYLKNDSFEWPKSN